MSPYEITGDSILSEQTANYINTADAAAALGRKGGKIGGSSKSDAKKKSSAVNGKLGGRPKGSGKKKDEDN